ncbi:MAG: alpha/beta fold hydrolase [Rhodospirillaceae bacterium]|nr:alpha/beta fold hydrolase [Rhodospirillaceae bacterium]
MAEISRSSLTAIDRRAWLAGGVALAALARWPRAQAAGVTVKRQYVDGPFGQIHVRIAAPADPKADTKPALACFHYSPGSGRMYEQILPLLATDRTVMAFDTPGYGNSTPPPKQPVLTDYVNALTTALTALGHGPAGKPIDLMGHLTGSLISVELATTQPKWIRRVVLSRSPAFSAQKRKDYTAEMIALAEGRKTDMKGQYLIDRLTRGLGQLRPGEPPELYMGAFIDSATPSHLWVYGEVAAISYPAEDKFPLITQPVLLFTYPDAVQEEWKATPKLLKTAKVIHLADAGPWVWQQQADMLAGHVRAFLDGV